MPTSVRVSMWLFLVSWPLGFLYYFFLDPAPLPQLPQPPLLYLMLVGTVLVMALAVNIALSAYQGRNWARWVLAAANILGFPGALREFFVQFARAPAVSSIHLGFFLIGALTTALLFLPEANRWYRHSWSSARVS
jgi:hypothetical protein